MSFRSFFLTLSLFLSTFLFASNEKIEQGLPLLKIETDIDHEGTLRLIISGPYHLETNELCTTYQTDHGIGIESSLILAHYPSENPQMISFYVLAQNTDQGIQITTNETQIFKIEGWFSDSFSKKQASQAILIEKKLLDLESQPVFVNTKPMLRNVAMFRLKTQQI